MKRSVLCRVVLPVVSLVVALGASGPTQDGTPAAARDRAERLFKDRNYNESHDVYRRLALDPANDPTRVGPDLHRAVECLHNLQRMNETDELREAAVAAHPKNWRLLAAAAQSCFQAPHDGFMVAGQFTRGPHRGGGRYVNSMERDRQRAMQLMQSAVRVAVEQAVAERGTDADKSDLAQVHLQFGRILMGFRGYSEGWRLQYLTDLNELPDYEEGYAYWRGGETRGAPVGTDGKPVFHRVPETYEDAASDGERWRWLLARAMALDPRQTNPVLMDMAQFLQNQFGEQTLAGGGYPWNGGNDDEDKDESGTYALHTLGEDETIARLATGIRRFPLPEEFNYIRLYRRVADNPAGGSGEPALNQLAGIFENRRQYDKAADLWKRSIKEYGDPNDHWKQKKVDQILGNWGRFENAATQPAGKGASVEFVFRNGSAVSFEARKIRARELLEDAKAYLRSNPRTLEWDKMNVGDIGYRLVTRNEGKYVGDQAAAWDMPLEPRPMHFDRRVTVQTPLKEPGAYLLAARMKDGNESRIVLWVADTVIVKKPMPEGAFLFVADAVTGEPVPKALIEFFGYKQEYVDPVKGLGRHCNVTTVNSAEFADADGQFLAGAKQFPRDHQWIITATTGDPAAGTGRFAFLGFSQVWSAGYHEYEYNQIKLFAITDRPVYRPGQTVKFKLWIARAQYDKPGESEFANQTFNVRIADPQGQEVLKQSYKADAYAGFDGEYVLPAEAPLGVYSLQVPNAGGGSFRVEEYKKPEFEVVVKAPEQPVMLGEKITATVRADYYFGAPVTEGRVKYKVLRSSHRGQWYPPGLWDWMYGPGYWWFACDYDWYPGWRSWGCVRPSPWWWPVGSAPPEVVAEAEVKIGPEGQVEIPIDTGVAKELHGDTDHRYEITAEVTDLSRRTIVGKGVVLAARKPFTVYAWVDRGHYRVGDVAHAEFSAQTLDGRAVSGKGSLRLFRIGYKDGAPTEKVAQKWDLDTDDQGRSAVQIKASEAGQYRLSYTVTDRAGHAIEGGYVFCVMGEGSDEKDFRFNEIELVPDKKEYAPGEKVRLRVNTDRKGGTALLFVRPANGVYLAPKVLRLKGKSATEEIAIEKRDMPNLFVEAFTVRGGKLYSETREIVVPPEKRVFDVKVLPSAERYKPGEKATVKVVLTDLSGEPVVGSAVLSVYDRAVEYISGGSNVPEIRAFFWKWRRQHRPQTECTLDRCSGNLVLPGQTGMSSLGLFGNLGADEFGGQGGGGIAKGRGGGFRQVAFQGLMMNGARAMKSLGDAMPAAAAAPPMAREASGLMMEAAASDKLGAGAPEAETVAEPAIRTKFADAAVWVAAVETLTNGTAEVSFPMPENLTGWKIRAWAMGRGTTVGEGAAEAVTAKDVMVRLQAPRFFVEKDEVVLSANVHNYLPQAKSVRAVLELGGECIELAGAAGRPEAARLRSEQVVEVPAGGEKRVDWRVNALREGEETVRMKALTDVESDAMEMRFPVHVHGMLKTESYCGVIRREAEKAGFEIRVPKERRPDQSRLELRYSPTLAGAIVDALPYLASYPYGCTEQTLNRFLPTVIARKILKDMGLDLKAIRDKRTNLNAQEIGDDAARAKQWKRWEDNPVFDDATVDDMVKEGLKRLAAMQLSDGGWGWFSGWGEYSSAHTTAGVVHGLLVARQNGVAVAPGVLSRGVDWLEAYQREEVRKIQNAPRQKHPWKQHADNLDAMVYMVLSEAGKENAEMREFLYRDRKDLAVYGLAVFGVALHAQNHAEQRDMVVRNIEQYIARDAENQTAWLNLGNEGYWWCWYGSEYEAHAYYLKLLAALKPQSDDAAGLVKYLLNNRKHATYWNSTRDTALCVEAMADYLRASKEDKPDMTVDVLLDGRKVKEARITADNLFTFDNRLVLSGKEVETGAHKVEVVRKGTGPVYFNAYLGNFTLEDFITRAGLEIKVQRKVYRLDRVDKTIKAAGSHGQALDQKVEKYKRVPLENGAELVSGDLVEVELEIESKNDYEYVVFEDMKAAGFEPVEVRSGYGGNDMGAYMELRDERVSFFVHALARGKHSVAYRLRAEIPGKFSALPTRAYAMYAPELKANSDEIKLAIRDAAR